MVAESGRRRRNGTLNHPGESFPVTASTRKHRGIGLPLSPPPPRNEMNARTVPIRGINQVQRYPQLRSIIDLIPDRPRQKTSSVRRGAREWIF